MGCFEFQGVCDPTVCSILGDLNGDGFFNGLDINPFVKCMISATPFCGCPCADMDRNGLIQFSPDVGLFINALLQKAETDPCEVPGGALPDCNGNAIPDEQDIFGFRTSGDCNGNRIPDECDIADETSTDLNSNGILDECEIDCDLDSIPDAWEIAQDSSKDINSNGVLDSCETDCNDNNLPDDYDIAQGAADCNANGQLDSCEWDCNANGVPDDCDIDPTDPDGNTFVSEDCNANGIPDECDLSRSMLPSFDCNDNDVPDECDIANSNSKDDNENRIPDECEEEFLMGGGGGGQSMMGGEGEAPSPPPALDGEEAEAAWEEFFGWYEEQMTGTPGDWGTLTGPERFERVMDELELLGLPLARPW